MMIILLQLSCLGMAVSLQTDISASDSKNIGETWGETHKRDPEVSPSETKTPFIVLPSTGNNNGYSLADFPRNNDWGLVEIDRDFDLQAVEFADKSDNFVYTQTDNPNEFLASSKDHWTVADKSTASSVIIDDRLFSTSGETDLTELDFTWNPTKQLRSDETIASSETKSVPDLADNQLVYQASPSYQPEINSNNWKAEHRDMELSGPHVDQLVVKSAINYGTIPAQSPQPIKQAISLPLLDNNNVYVDSAFQSPPPPLPPSPPAYSPDYSYDALPSYTPVYQTPGFPAPALPSNPPPDIQNVKRPPLPPPRPIRNVQSSPAQPPLRVPLQPALLVKPIQPKAKLSNNPLTRFKQQLNLPIPADAHLPSLNQIHRDIKSVLPRLPALPKLPTFPRAPPRQGNEQYGIKIPTYFGNIIPGTRKPFLQKIKDSLLSLIPTPPKVSKPVTYAAVTTAAPYADTAVATVTEIPLPLPVPTYLPINKESEFSTGFQILIQYIAAMVGIALVLAI